MSIKINCVLLGKYSTYLKIHSRGISLLVSLLELSAAQIT